MIKDMATLYRHYELRQADTDAAQGLFFPLPFACNPAFMP